MVLYMYFHVLLVIWDWQLLRHSVYLPYRGLIRRIFTLVAIATCEMLMYHYKTGLSHVLLNGVCGLIYVCIYELKR